MDRRSKEIGPSKLMMAFMSLVTYFHKRMDRCAFGPLLSFFSVFGPKPHCQSVFKTVRISHVSNLTTVNQRMDCSAYQKKNNGLLCDRCMHRPNDHKPHLNYMINPWLRKVKKLCLTRDQSCIIKSSDYYVRAIVCLSNIHCHVN